MMIRNALIGVSLASTLAIAGLWLNGDLASAQDAPSAIGKNGGLEWDAVTTNEDGTPINDLRHYTVGAFAVGQNPNNGADPIASVDTTETRIGIAKLQGLAAGPVDFYVSATDTHDNRSAWSGPLSTTFDPVSPTPPGGLRIVVNVTVNIEQ